MELTPAIKAYVEKKIGGLDKFLAHLGTAVEAWVEVGRTSFHHHTGEGVFRAECDLRVPHKVLRAEATDKDLHTAIVKVKDELQIQIKKYKGEKERNLRESEREIAQ